MSRGVKIPALCLKHPPRRVGAFWTRVKVPAARQTLDLQQCDFSVSSRNLEKAFLFALEKNVIFRFLGLFPTLLTHVEIHTGVSCDESVVIGMELMLRFH